MDERVAHLKATETDSFEKCCLLLIILDVNCLLQYGLCGLALLDVDTQVDDEAENFIVAVVDGRYEWRHPLKVLHLEHFGDLGA